MIGIITSKEKLDVTKFILSLWCIVLIVFSTLTAEAQITFVVDALPKSTLNTDTLYLSGSFNKWDPSDENYRLTLKKDGMYDIPSLSFDHSSISFKITRGSWENVEVDTNGLPILVRKLSFKKFEKQTVSLSVKGWADRDGIVNKNNTVTLRLEKIPESTPPNATIYVTGNFNGWTPGDQRYQLNKSADGTYAIDIPVYSKRLEYKFTRGNWATVEGKKYGRPRPNRVVNLNLNASSKPIVSSIFHWEDQSFGFFNPYTLVLALTAIQGILLIFIINSYKNNNRLANQTLNVFIFLISFALITRIVIYDRNIYTEHPKISLISDVIYFLYAPLFFIYIKRLFNKSRSQNSKEWLRFVPFAIHFIIILWIFLEPTKAFFEQNIFQSGYSLNYGLYDIVIVIALLFNIWYWFKIRFIVNSYFKNIEETYSNDQNITYLNNIMTIIAISLILWIAILIISGYGLFKGYNFQSITNVLIDAIWIVFAFLVYLMGYFAIKQPEIFKINPEEKTEVGKPHLGVAELEQIKTELNRVMESEKIYLNPSLNLPELAEKMDSNIHILSRAINEGFNKNFRDFVNHYRILDFIDRAQQENYKNQTFLAIALDVGFNSKTSFNRCFKKHTGKSPRDFFNSQRQA